MQALKMPVKTAKFKLDGDYAGFEFVARTNFPISYAEDFQAGDVSLLILRFSDIVKSWNFPDENGESLGDPSDVEVMGKVPSDLISLMAELIVNSTMTVPNA